MGSLEFGDNIFEVIKTPKIKVITIVAIGCNEELLKLFWIESSFDDLSI